jgi:hypothetical protein
MKTDGGRKTTTPGGPWYRHRWPWLIIALLGSSVAGSFLSAYLALRYPEVILDRSDEPAATAREHADPHG